MGIYLNPGKRRYQMAHNSDIYIDKTEMLVFLNSVINTNQRYVCVSRPRRFGKTMAADMLCAYYDKSVNSREDFTGYALTSHVNWDRFLNQFDVIRITITDFLGDSADIADMLDYLTEELIAELTAAFPMIQPGTRRNLRTLLTRIYAETERPFVIVIDEWDAVFRKYSEDDTGQNQYLDFMRDWLKDQPYVALAYMTGILPVKKYGNHSALNMFDEYSMMAPMQLASFAGFTEDEVKLLCSQYGRDFQAMREWYDGYRVSDIIPPDPDYRSSAETGLQPQAKTWSLYNPLSVVNAVRTGLIRNYWNKTETYEALAEYIRKNFDGLKEAVAVLMDGGHVEADLNDYQNDMTTFHSKDDVMALLVHLGYLGYDESNGTVFIPNKEILTEFRTSTKSDEWTTAFSALNHSRELLEATWAGDAERVAALVEAAHDQAGNRTYNSEAALSYAIQLAYYSALNYYTLIPEMDSGKGFADLVYLPSPDYSDKPALLIELKFAQSAVTAIDQIHQKRYPARLRHYQGNLIVVGINYNRELSPANPEYKHHSCVIERW